MKHWLANITVHSLVIKCFTYFFILYAGYERKFSLKCVFFSRTNLICTYLIENYGTVIAVSENMCTGLEVFFFKYIKYKPTAFVQNVSIIIYFLVYGNFSKLLLLIEQSRLFGKCIIWKVSALLRK